MRNLMRRRPTPAMIVAVTALIAAMAVPAIAVKHHSKHADARQDRALIKKLAPGLSVRFAKSAGTAATADHATAADRATNADRAASADRAINADHATNADQLAGLTPDQFERAGHLVPINVRMSNTDAARTLLSAGPFTVTGHCTPQTPQQNVIAATATTSENDSAIHGVNFQNVEYGDADFDAGDVQTISSFQEGGTPPGPSGPFPATAFMIAPSGAQVSLTLTEGTRLFSDNGNQRVACVFGGYAVVS